MQLLKIKYKLFSKSIMNRLFIIALLGFILISAGMSQNAFAIGKWRKGVVSTPPWQSNFTYITIKDTQNTRYIIMKDAKKVYVYEKNGAQYEKPLSLSAIHKGDILLFMVEGNRIYQIKKIH